MRQTSALQSYDIEHNSTFSRSKNCTKRTMLYFLTSVLLNLNILLHFCAQHKYFWQYVLFTWVEYLNIVHTADCRTSRGQIINMNSTPAWKSVIIHWLAKLPYFRYNVLMSKLFSFPDHTHFLFWILLLWKQILHYPDEMTSKVEHLCWTDTVCLCSSLKCMNYTVASS